MDMINSIHDLEESRIQRAILYPTKSNCPTTVRFVILLVSRPTCHSVSQVLEKRVTLYGHNGKEFFFAPDPYLTKIG